MTRNITAILLFCWTLTACGQTKIENKNIEQQYNGKTIDSEVVAVLPFDTIQYWFFKGSRPTDLTNDDLLKIETILNKCINDYNSDQERQFKEINDKNPEYKLDKKNFIIDLKRYKRQYVAAINSKGEKEVWVNCFCSALNSNWEKVRIIVKDGGNCYFNLKINLTTEQYYELMVNGDA